MLEAVEQTRLSVSKNTEAKRKSELGQFLTPAKTAQFMAGLFTSKSSLECRLLDAGAGIGSLSSAFLERCINGELRFKTIEVTGPVVDFRLKEHLCEMPEPGAVPISANLAFKLCRNC